ncbi:putative mac1 interacting protein 1 [Diaporthe ampelina]|uniref:Putative mac1 interacting protein 1 n=1 Tax=Diaporthe ampelina TaxID=1214573 RepID=A0A0G2I057_9PEZI|nr:putative mac1 interacting protein 1 [Diaporthe ampelina]
MRLVSLHALVLVSCGVAVAQDCINVALTAIPGCAQNCILNGAPSIGCQGTDFSCQCAQSAALYAAVEGCVSSACPSASYQAVIDGSDEAPTASSGSSGGTTGGGSGTGSGNTFTGYSSVSPIATASVIGAAAQATPVINAIRYVVPVVMVGAAVL